jgi:hypothetical protein
MPKLWPIPIIAMPAVPKEVPVAREVTAQIRKAAGRNSCGLISDRP